MMCQWQYKLPFLRTIEAQCVATALWQVGVARLLAAWLGLL